MKLIGVPLAGYMLLAAEGGFVLWERAADFVAEGIPYSVEWNYLAAWIGSGTFVYCLCRYFQFAPLRTIIVMAGLSFAAFVMFM